MFCKHCGDHIDRKTMRCTNCGTPVGSLEGGVFFRDLAGELEESKQPRPAIPPNLGEVERLIRENTERTDRGLNYIYKRQIQIGRKQTMLLMLIPVLLAASIIVDICLLTTMKGIRNEFAETTEEINTVETTTATAETEPPLVTELFGGEETPMLPEQTEATVDANLSDDLLGADTGEIKLGAGPTKETVRISLDAGDESEITVFKARATGEKLEFEWQKNVDGDWYLVDEVHPGVFRCDDMPNDETDAEEGQTISMLYIKRNSITMEIAGDYRCVVWNNFNVEKKVIGTAILDVQPSQE